ncbi:hypothetical protein TNCV_2967481 [Trichonephila clavipes]|nr:hypothetical protein TNCV_2967481 [Trichonephila clavipes]
MSKPYTYGSICEVMAAGEIFLYKFRVYQDGSLVSVFGDALQGIRRLWFTGNFNEGHFDALVPLDEAIINGIQLSHFNEPKLLTSSEQIGCENIFPFSMDTTVSLMYINQMSLFLLFNQKEEQNVGKDLQVQSDISK